MAQRCSRRASRGDEARHRRRRHDAPASAARAAERAPARRPRRLSGIVFYEPAEMVALRQGRHAARARSRRRSREHGQMLPFEPMDHRALYGGSSGEPTIGGLVATNISGPAPHQRRRGARRRHRPALVNGRGETDPLRRPGDEERHRPRSRQTQLRRAWHARPPDRGDVQAAAKPEAEATHRHPPPRRRARHRGA